MKVCFIAFRVREDIGSGIPRYTYQLIHNLMKIGRSLSIKYIEFGDNPKGTVFRWLKRTLFAIKMYDVDANIYHAVTPALAWPLILSRKRPIVVTVHDLFPLYPDLYRISKPECEIYRLILTRCDLIISTAEYWKRDLIQYFKLPEDKIAVVPVGVDHSKFRPLKVPKDEKIKRILYVGSLSFEKGLDLLLKAFKIVLKKLPNTRLFVGGKGPQGSYFKRLAIQLGIASHVEFLGFIPEEKLPYYYNIADVFVYPSRIGFGLMLLEAMACSTPVIAVNRFQVPEYVGDAGILVEPGNIKQLAEAIIRVLTDEELRNTLSKKALKRSQQFTWEKTARMTLEAYWQLIQK